jgi:uncharacterized repeat protein (TIGR03803 family)
MLEFVLSRIPMISRTSWKKILFVISLSAATPILSRAQAFKTLIIFDGTNGATPVDTPLVQGTNGNLYGTTLGGGSHGSGTVFEITRAGKLTTLYSFCSQSNCADGSGPYGGLVLGNDGNFYGTTSTGGADGISGTVFRITPDGTLTTLHSFNGADGSRPMAPMILTIDGNFYGITENGGPILNAGTIFKITRTGTLTTLHSFGSGDGSFANGPLVQGADGNFYGTTEIGGANGFGTIFKVTPSGSFSTFHSFNSTDGSAPACGLVLASNGNLFGTTYEGGSNNSCPNGTVFKITMDGTLTTLHSFDSNNGANPIAGLIRATDGNFYGTTYAGGRGGGWGTLFKITPSGTVTTLHSFEGTDGAQPYGPVTQATSGSLYGTATNGTSGASEGTLFEVDLGPFVSFVSNAGKVGQGVGILGQGFTGTSSVSFNGISAAFTVKSGTFLTATVPVGATSGFVRVTTPSGTLKSNVPFQVVP